LNPEVIVIGGGAGAGRASCFSRPARRVVAHPRACDPSRDVVRIVPAHFGEEAGMIGAAAFALTGGEA